MTLLYDQFEIERDDFVIADICPETMESQQHMSHDTMQLIPDDKSQQFCLSDTPSEGHRIYNGQCQHPYDTSDNEDSPPPTRTGNAPLTGWQHDMDNLDSLGRDPLDRALTEGRVKMAIVGRRIRTMCPQNTTSPSRHVEYIIQVQVRPLRVCGPVKGCCIYGV